MAQLIDRGRRCLNGKLCDTLSPIWMLMWKVAAWNLLSTQLKRLRYQVNIINNKFMFWHNKWNSQGTCTGKSLSEVLIYLSINPQHDNKLFNDLRVQYKKIPRAERIKNKSRTCYLHKLFWIYKQRIWELHPNKNSLGIAEFKKKTLSKVIS